MSKKINEKYFMEFLQFALDIATGDTESIKWAKEEAEELIIRYSEETRESALAKRRSI